MDDIIEIMTRGIFSSNHTEQNRDPGKQNSQNFISFEDADTYARGALRALINAGYQIKKIESTPAKD